MQKGIFGFFPELESRNPKKPTQKNLGVESKKWGSNAALFAELNVENDHDHQPDDEKENEDGEDAP